MRSIRLNLLQLALEATMGLPDGRPNILKSVLEESDFPFGDINLVSGRGYTLLMHAVTTGNTDSVRLLIESGADPNLGKTDRGHRAIDLVRRSEDVGVKGRFSEIGELLVAAGADEKKLPISAMLAELRPKKAPR